jgi:hypothetical protein
MPVDGRKEEKNRGIYFVAVETRALRPGIDWLGRGFEPLPTRFLKMNHPPLFRENFSPLQMNL